MNIGFVLYGTLDSRSGGFRYDRQLITALRNAGDTVDVIELPWRSYPRGLLDNVSPRFRRRLGSGYDILLQDELAHPSLAWTNDTISTPIVTLVHLLRTNEPRQFTTLYRAVERRYLRSVDGIVCNSTVTRTEVTDIAGQSRQTVIAPPAGDRFDPSADTLSIADHVHSEPLQLLFVGNLIPRKGVDTLIEGLSMSGTTAELTVVGQMVDADHVARVRQQVAKENLTDRVTFAGELSDPELAANLRQHHVLAVPSQYEGYGIVYLEGMSFGLPVIAARAGGATDFVTDGENGFLVDPGDAAAVADAITTLAADRDRLATMGQAARRRYETQPDWAETAATVRTLLESVVDDATG